jgi:hypothetical protein
MAKFDPKVLNKLNTTFKDLITATDKQSEEISGIVLTCFTYLLVALGNYHDNYDNYDNSYDNSSIVLHCYNLLIFK